MEIKPFRKLKSFAGRLKGSKSPEYAVEFAPDGQHFQTLKSGKIDRLYDYFTQDPSIREQMLLNPSAVFRLKNLKTEQVIGTLPRERMKLSGFA